MVLKINYKDIKMAIKQPIVNENDDPGVSRIPVQSQVRKTISNALPKYHWARQPVDARDYPYLPTLIESLASSIDLRQYCSPIDDQGQLGSCTGNAIAGAIDLLDRKTYNLQTRVSRLFIYYYERLIEGTVNYDNGAYIRDGMRATSTYGAPVENLWPYNINMFRTRPSNQAITDAAKRKVTLYQAASNFTAVQNALANGYPVVIGFDVYSSFEGAWGNIRHGQSGAGMMPYPNTRTEQLLGGHAVCLVGYNNANNTFIARNSWGTSWGDNGYFYMPYQVIQNTNMSSDFWVIKSVNDPA